MISVIIPYKYENKIREELLEVVLEQYRSFSFIDEIIIGDDTSGEDVFCRAHAINNGVDRSSGDILIIADADIIIHSRTLLMGIKRAKKENFIIPFGSVIYINQETTNRMVARETVTIDEMENKPFAKVSIRPESFTYYKKMAGGINIITRELFNKIMGYDKRFINWGYEDIHFCCKILNELGDYNILADEKVYHLQHPRGRIFPSEHNRNIAKEETDKLGIILR
jgi:predicted glycosyltransferase involved in capsule biosynthesis